MTRNRFMFMSSASPLPFSQQSPVSTLIHEIPNSRAHLAQNLQR